LYAYVLNNPSTFCDELGLLPITLPGFEIDIAKSSDSLLAGSYFFNKGLDHPQDNILREDSEFRNSIFNRERPISAVAGSGLTSPCDVHANMGYINGIANTFTGAYQSAQYLSDLAGGMPMN